MADFDADAYWRDYAGHLAGPFYKSYAHLLVEDRLGHVLLRTPGESVLEVGCGGGRIAHLLGWVRPDWRYTGIDIGARQIAATAEARPDAELIQSRVQDFAPGERRWDVVITSEVLMHIPPDDIAAVADKLKRIATTIVLVEWVPNGATGLIAPENWPHDYEALFGPLTHSERVAAQKIMVAGGPLHEEGS